MSLSKCPILESEPLCLRATGAGIVEIDTLTQLQTEALSLYVSNNYISKLDNIIQFKSLEKLLIEYNQIANIEDLYPLAKLTKLKELRMNGNPVCRSPLFTMYILYLIPGLENLNGKEVSSFNYSSQELRNYILAENQMLRFILTGDVIINQIKNSPNEKIRSVDTEASNLYPRESVIAIYGKIRKEGEELPLDKYFSYLKDLVIQKHQEISRLTHEANLDNPKTQIHDEKLANFTSSDKLDEYIKSLSELHDAACFIIEDEKLDKSDQKSITSFFTKKFGFNFDRPKSVSPKYSVQKMRNRDAQSTIAGNTDAKSILGYYLGDDENIDAKSMKSARSARSRRRESVLSQMKQGTYTPKSVGNRKHKRQVDNSSQASIDDVALNIEDGKITLIDPKHPDINIFAIEEDEEEDEKEIEKEILNKEKIDSNILKPELENNYDNSVNQTINGFPQPAKSSLSSKRDDRNKNPDKKVTLLINKNEIKTNNNNEIETKSGSVNETSSTQIADGENKEKNKNVKRFVILPNVDSLRSYFSKWKSRHLDIIKDNDKSISFSGFNYSLEDVSALSVQTKNLDDKIQFLKNHQKNLSDREQLTLIVEATKRRELIRNIENLRERINQKSMRACQFQKEAYVKERYMGTTDF